MVWIAAALIGTSHINDDLYFSSAPDWINFWEIIKFEYQLPKNKWYLNFLFLFFDLILFIVNKKKKRLLLHPSHCWVSNSLMTLTMVRFGWVHNWEMRHWNAGLTQIRDLVLFMYPRSVIPMCFRCDEKYGEAAWGLYFRERHGFLYSKLDRLKYE